MLYWVPLLAIVLPPVLLVGGLVARRWTVRLPKATPANTCMHCGYNLTGNVSGRCPECGEVAVLGPGQRRVGNAFLHGGVTTAAVLGGLGCLLLMCTFSSSIETLERYWYDLAPNGWLLAAAERDDLNASAYVLGILVARDMDGALSGAEQQQLIDALVKQVDSAAAATITYWEMELVDDAFVRPLETHEELGRLKPAQSAVLDAHAVQSIDRALDSGRGRHVFFQTSFTDSFDRVRRRLENSRLSASHGRKLFDALLRGTMPEERAEFLTRFTIGQQLVTTLLELHAQDMLTPAQSTRLVSDLLGAEPLTVLEPNLEGQPLLVRVPLKPVGARLLRPLLDTGLHGGRKPAMIQLDARLIDPTSGATFARLAGHEDHERLSEPDGILFAFPTAAGMLLSAEIEWGLTYQPSPNAAPTTLDARGRITLPPRIAAADWEILREDPGMMPVLHELTTLSARRSGSGGEVSLTLSWTIEDHDDQLLLPLAHRVKLTGLKGEMLRPQCGKLPEYVDLAPGGSWRTCLCGLVSDGPLPEELLIELTPDEGRAARAPQRHAWAGTYRRVVAVE